MIKRGRMEDTLERKVKDEVWIARELITRPNWAVLKLMRDGKPRTNEDIYRALGKQFTRKTLIRSIWLLSFGIRAFEPQHVTGQKRFEVGYTLTPEVLEIMQQLERFQKIAAKRL